MTADDRPISFAVAALWLGAGLGLCGADARAAAAGQVQFVAGEVRLERGGSSQDVLKGTGVEVGDVLRSGPTGQAQIRFSDGGIMALYPRSQMAVEAYGDSAQDGSSEDRFAVRFLQGALRAVTGKIGRRNPQSYRVITPTAVVGIRGTAFKVFLNAQGEVEVSGEHNTIDVCTEAGCVEVQPREAVRVPSAQQLPVYTQTQALLPLPLPRTPFQAGEQVLPGGAYAAVLLDQRPLPPAPPQPSPVVPTIPGMVPTPDPIVPGNPADPGVRPGTPSAPGVPAMPSVPPATPTPPGTPAQPNPVVPTTPAVPVGQSPGTPATPTPTTPTTPTTPLGPIRPVRPIIPVVPIAPIIVSPAPIPPIR